MKLHSLEPPKGARKDAKRVGRGPGSGHGTYATRGLKGQKARMSGKPPAWFEGGQMPLQRRVPKRGFTNHGRVETQPVNLDDLDARAGSEFPLAALYELGLASPHKGPVKILGRGTIGRAVRVEAHRFSRSAREAIEAAGGSVEVLERPKRRGKPAPRAERGTEAGAGG
ncbi:MAG: 50S ribosomal protein L15 [Gemmatimonadetes bacterium]|nr:50S ribosomal protein L15 [Gemmatimonadota bacterium]